MTPQEEARYVMTVIEDLRGRPEYDWAAETLEGIHATIRGTDRVTLRQREAVEHIILGRLKHDVRAVEE